MFVSISRYTAVYYVCKPQSDLMPDFVSITTEETIVVPSNIIPINSPHSSNSRVLSACVPPLHGDFDDVIQLIEWIELNKLLGVEFFTFYVSSVSERVKYVLKYYADEDELEVLQWSLPIPDDEIHYHGQLAAINNCLYRNKASTQYLQFTDLDEYIVPQHSNVTSITSLLESELHQEISVFIFRHALFPKAVKLHLPVNMNLIDKNLRHNLVTQVCLLMSNRIRGKYNRSKLIVNPAHVVTMGIHQVWAASPECVFETVDVKSGILHHYTYGLEEDAHNGLVMNNSTLKYIELGQNVHTILDHLKLEL